ncbi:hypothetical protein MTO96_037301 [Rhipicephalus appendiculatus]
MDIRLAHLIEAKQSLLSRRKQLRLNRRLRKKIAEVTKNIEEHCKVLSRQERGDVCNFTDGRMRWGGSWSFLKHFQDETSTKSNQRSTLARILHKGRQESSGDGVQGNRVTNYEQVASGPMDPSTPSRITGASTTRSWTCSLGSKMSGGPHVT